MKHPHRQKVGKPGITRNVYGIRPPRQHARHERRVSQTEEMVCPWCRRGVGHHFGLITASQRNIPLDFPPKTMVQGRRLATVPGEEDLDLNIVPLGQPPVKGHIVLDRVRDDKSQADSVKLLQRRYSLHERRHRITHTLAISFPGARFRLRPGGLFHGW